MVQRTIDGEEVQPIATARDQYHFEYNIRQPPHDEQSSRPSSIASSLIVDPNPHLFTYPSNETNKILSCVAKLRDVVAATIKEMAEQRVALRYSQRNISNLYEELSSLSRIVQETITTPQPLTNTVPMSHPDFLKYLDKAGLTYLTPYTDQLDSKADYAAAPTPRPDQKRCTVGRPRGKILRLQQFDDPGRQLCAKHKNAADFQLDIDRAQGRSPWECFLKNLVDEEGG